MAIDIPAIRLRVARYNALIAESKGVRGHAGAASTIAAMGIAETICVRDIPDLLDEVDRLNTQLQLARDPVCRHPDPGGSDEQ